LSTIEECLLPALLIRALSGVLRGALPQARGPRFLVTAQFLVTPQLLVTPPLLVPPFLATRPR
jgi:hypothetical protein